LQGNRCWDAIWTSLVEFASDRGLAQIKLDIGIAWMHEGYHGAWRRSRMPDKPDQATLKLPIYVDQRLVGRLEVICNANSASLHDTLQLLLDRASELSFQIKRLMENDGRLPELLPATAKPSATTDTTTASETKAVDSPLSHAELAFFSPTHEANA